MKEHIQETNLIDSFFIRFKSSYVPCQKSKVQKYASQVKSLKQQTREARKKVMSTFLEYESKNDFTHKQPQKETKKDISKDLEIKKKDKINKSNRKRTHDLNFNSKDLKKSKKTVKILSHHDTPMNKN